MSNKKQIDRIHKIISVALQGDTEYMKQKLERKFNLQTSQEYWFHTITVRSYNYAFSLKEGTPMKSNL